MGTDARVTGCQQWLNARAKMRARRGLRVQLIWGMQIFDEVGWQLWACEAGIYRLESTVLVMECFVTTGHYCVYVYPGARTPGQQRTGDKWPTGGLVALLLRAWTAQEGSWPSGPRP